MKKLILLYVVFSFLLVSCEKTIDFTGEKTDPLVVVNSVITPDSLFQTEISKSLHLRDTGNFPEVTDAVVDIFEQGNLVTTLTHQNKGIYTSKFSPMAGKNYEIKVSTSGKTVSAETKIPNKVNIESVELNTIDDKGIKKHELTIKFNDPAEINNFYKVSLLVNDEASYSFDGDKNSIETEVYSFWATISSNDPVFLATFGQDDAFDNSPNNMYNIFTDDLINGKSYDLKILTDTYIGDTTADEQLISRKLKYTVFLNSISKEYFYYLKSRNLSYWYGDNPFSEPVPVFSNIKGGAGILGAYSSAIDSVLITF